MLRCCTHMIPFHSTWYSFWTLNYLNTSMQGPRWIRVTFEYEMHMRCKRFREISCYGQFLQKFVPCAASTNSVSVWYTGLLKMIVGVLTTYHTQYTWNRRICIFLIEQHSRFLWHTLQVLYICTLCDSTNTNTKIEFVPNCNMSAVRRSPPS